MSNSDGMGSVSPLSSASSPQTSNINLEFMNALQEAVNILVPSTNNNTSASTNSTSESETVSIPIDPIGEPQVGEQLGLTPNLVPVEHTQMWYRLKCAELMMTLTRQFYGVGGRSRRMDPDSLIQYIIDSGPFLTSLDGMVETLQWFDRVAWNDDVIVPPNPFASFSPETYEREGIPFDSLVYVRTDAKELLADLKILQLNSVRLLRKKKDRADANDETGAPEQSTNYGGPNRECSLQ